MLSMPTGLTIYRCQQLRGTAKTCPSWVDWFGDTVGHENVTKYDDHGAGGGDGDGELGGGGDKEGG